MIPFYCPGFSHVTKEELEPQEPQEDWKPKLEAAVLGYSDESKG